MNLFKQPGPVLLTSFVALFFAAGGCGGSEVAEQADTTETATPAVSATAVVNPNLAGSDELAMLPGMTAELADMVLEARPFPGMIELDALISAHMSREDATALYARMFIPLNLNTATDEEILAIPGVGDRMAHEFKEYRPYSNMDQFRREIGKYVDDGEVARLERYVEIRSQGP